MEKFHISKNDEKINSINRTIRFKPEVFDQLMEISEKTGISFNKVVAQCLSFALEHYEEV